MTFILLLHCNKKKLSQYVKATAAKYVKTEDTENI